MTGHGPIMRPDVATPDNLSGAQLSVLHACTYGMASLTTRTVIDLANGLLGVNANTARQLVDRGLLVNVPQWRAVELTDKGRAALGRYGHLR